MAMPAMQLRRAGHNPRMLWLLFEALLALALLLFIVWWTMFAGRRRGEPARDAGTSTVGTPGAASSAEPSPQVAPAPDRPSSRPEDR
jgi:hypothetical protein